MKRETDEQFDEQFDQLHRTRKRMRFLFFCSQMMIFVFLLDGGLPSDVDTVAWLFLFVQNFFFKSKNS